MRKSQAIYRKPHFLKKKKPIYKNRIFWFGIFLALFFSAALYSVFFLPAVQIKEVIISGNRKTSTEDLEKLILPKTEANFLFLRSKSIFLANLSLIEKDVLESFPQISRVKTIRQLPSLLKVEISERQPVGSFCKEENCYLIDAEGIIFEPAQPGSILLIQDSRNNSDALSSGQKVVEKDYMDTILKIQKRLKEDIKLDVLEFVIKSDSLNVKISEGWEAYLDAKGDADWQIAKLGAVLQEKIPSEKRGSLEYIELRFGNLAPFKYR